MAENILSLQTQTIEKFKNPQFAIQFAVDNNPYEIFGKLKEMGFGDLLTGNIATDKAIAKQLMLDWYKQKQTSRLLEIVNNVHYLNNDSSSSDYTKGYREYFYANSPDITEASYSDVETQGQRFSIDGLLAALGSGLTTYSGFSSMGGFQTPEQMQQIAQEKEEAEKKKRLWLTIGLIIGLIAIIGIILLIVKSKKKKSN